MVNSLEFSCICGAVSGSVENATPKDGDYVYCHCSDCQSVPRHLGCEQRILEDHGGTALYQSRCGSLKIKSGRDKLAGLHMTDKPTLRWYAGCCNTPMFNTYQNGRIPYVTTLLANCDEEGRARLGNPIGHLFLEDAPGDTSTLNPLSMNKLLRRFFPRMLKDIFSGDRRKCPLFDGSTNEPIAAPRRLTSAEREAL